MAFAAYIISLGLNRGIDKLEKKFKLKHFLSTIIVYTLFVGVIFLIASFAIPPLINEITDMIYSIRLPEDWQTNLLGSQLNFDITAIGDLLEKFGSSISTAVNVVSSTFSGGFIVITTMIISLYLSLDKPEMMNHLAWVTTDKKKLERTEDFINEVDTQLGHWIRGQLILMTIVGLAVFVGTSLIGIPYSLLLGVISFFLEIVPNIGPTVAAIPGILLALAFLGWPGAIAAFVLYTVIQQLENNFIVPKIMKNNVDVNALTSILGILIGAKLFGVIGALLAIPIFIVIRTVYTNYLKYSGKDGLF
jgi:predicted PurR-regulated permease PerM